MSRRAAELTKYAGNAFLATKITFHGDPGYGGLCFPKDTLALIQNVHQSYASNCRHIEPRRCGISRSHRRA